MRVWIHIGIVDCTQIWFNSKIVVLPEVEVQFVPLYGLYHFCRLTSTLGREEMGALSTGLYHILQTGSTQMSYCFQRSK